MNYRYFWKNKIYILEGIMVGIFTFMLLKSDYVNPSFNLQIYSLPDSIIRAMTPFYYGLAIVPFLVGAVIYCIRDDFLNTRILFFHSKKELWMLQEKHMLNISVYFAFVFLVSIFLFGLWKQQIYFNWGNYESYYFINTHEVFKGNVVQIWIVTFLICSIRNFIFCNMILLAKWWTKRTMPGVLTVTVICVTEMVLSNIKSMMLGIKEVKLVIRQFPVDYQLFQNWKERLHIIVFLVAVLFIGYGLLNAAIKKREFIYDKIF